ncbi:hypothetical protein [Nocardioides sp. YIM 152315]|uniref:hypothetical protein n=1 Tax=Nocardioides sp. YIM 152315 TaxID=3031760 RepID=UPI0023DA8B93|nr:hypothetical protein [Nocardioides sp. YIM 152315]MDF1603019.1 hypothetical protein [Nocardioides sp. YIM 152315]
MSTAPDQPRRAGRPRWWVAGLMLCVLVAAALVGWSATRDDTYVAPTPRAARPSVEPVEAGTTLTAFEQAVIGHDSDAARELAPEGDAAAADRLAALVTNAEALRVTDFTVRYVDDDGAPTGEGEWTAAVDVTWRFRGFDRVSARAEVSAHLVDDGDRVALTGFGGVRRVSPVWLSGPVDVRRTPATLVLVAEGAGDADRYAARAEAAVPAVRRVLPDWRRGLVVEVPGSAQALEQALRATAGDYDQIAAVTTAADGSAAPQSAVHVFANPDVFGGLRPTGAQVVMSHEATHVATGAWDSRAPLWLLEGFADYVALRDVDLPVERSAAQIIAAVRRSGPPRTLPDAAAFGARTPRLGATYESAWLACRLVAEEAGEDALVAFYRAVDRGRSVGSALVAASGLTVAQLTGEWRDYLVGLAA